MKQMVVSHRLSDVSSDLSFDNEDFDPTSIQQLVKGLGADATALNSTAGLRPAPPKGPKPYADVPLPPPERPLVWKTKLVRHQQLLVCAAFARTPAQAI
jgi:hypothetical protein